MKNESNQNKIKFNKDKFIYGLWVSLIVIASILLILFLVVAPIVYVCLSPELKENAPQWVNVLCWVMILGGK